MTEIPWRTIDCPGFAGLLIKSNTESTPLLSKITLPAGIHHMGMLRIPIVDLGDFICHNVLMFHRMKREINPRHCANLSRPKTPCVDKMLCNNHTFVSNNFPTSINALICCGHEGMQFNLGAVHSSAFGIGMRRARRIKMPIKRII